MRSSSVVVRYKLDGGRKEYLYAADSPYTDYDWNPPLPIGAEFSKDKNIYRLELHDPEIKEAEDTFVISERSPLFNILAAPELKPSVDVSELFYNYIQPQFDYVSR